MLQALVNSFSYETAEHLPLPAVQTLLKVIVIAQELPKPLLETKPLVQIVGPVGSGKTALARVVGRIIAGPDWDVCGLPSTERDFWPVAADPAVFDNIETPPRWLPDALARATSGVQHRDRKLFTNDQIVSLRARGWIWVCSFSGAHCRGDLLDRSLIIRLAIPPDRKSDRCINDWLAKHGATVKSEVAAVALAVQARAAQSLPAQAPPEAGRLADFAIIGELIADVIGGAQEVELFKTALGGMRLERYRLASGDQNLAALIAWASSPGNKQEDGTPGRWLTARMLLDNIADSLDASHGFDFTKRDAIKFGRFISDLMREAAGILSIRSRVRQGRTEYQILSSISSIPGGQP